MYHREEGDLDFLNTLFKEIGNECDLSLLTVGDGKEAGLVMMSGPEDVLKELGPKIMELLVGKGGYAKGRFQGRVNKLQNREKAEKLLQEYT